jgi:hypothetical protein
VQQGSTGTEDHAHCGFDVVAVQGTILRISDYQHMEPQRDPRDPLASGPQAVGYGRWMTPWRSVWISRPIFPRDVQRNPRPPPLTPREAEGRECQLCGERLGRRRVRQDWHWCHRYQLHLCADCSADDVVHGCWWYPRQRSALLPLPGDWRSPTTRRLLENLRDAQEPPETRAEINVYQISERTRGLRRQLSEEDIQAALDAASTAAGEAHEDPLAAAVARRTTRWGNPEPF